MSRWWRVYSYFLCGAFGGLFGWFFAAELLGVLDHRGFRFAHQGAEFLVDEVVLLSQ